MAAKPMRCYGVALVCRIQMDTIPDRHECKQAGVCIFAPKSPEEPKVHCHVCPAATDEYCERNCLDVIAAGDAGVPAAPAHQPDESKLPPRPAGSNDANTDPDSPLMRYGRASKESGLLLEPMDDGYWTPWHIANELLRAALKETK